MVRTRQDPADKRVRLWLDFPDPQALAAFVEHLKEAGMLSDNAGAYRTDGLDRTAEKGGIPFGRTYLIRKQGERMEAARLTFQETTTRTV